MNRSLHRGWLTAVIIFAVMTAHAAEETPSSSREYPEIQDEVIWLEDEVSLPKAVKDSVSTALKDAALIWYHDQENASALERMAQCFFLVESIDPKHKDSVVLKYQIKKNLTAPIPVSERSTEDIAKALIEGAKSLTKMDTDDSNRLATALLEQSTFLDGSNADAIFDFQMLTQDGYDLPWEKLFASETTDSDKKSEEKPTSEAIAVAKDAKRIEKIQILLVRTSSDTRAVGIVNKLIGTLKSRLDDQEVLATFTDEEVGDSMEIAKEEATRLVELGLNEGDHGFHFDISFENKYSSKDGGSLGTALTLLLQSFEEPFEIDQSIAITGDITVDGASEKIGGVFEKFEAARDTSDISGVVFPEENRQELTDYFILKGFDAIRGIQIFTVKDVTEAKAILGTEKPPPVIQAMELYNQWEKKHYSSPHSVTAAQELMPILELMPNHFSANVILQKTNRQLPGRMSLSTSVDELFKASIPFLPFVFDHKFSLTVDPDTIYFNPISDQVCSEAIRQLNELNFKTANEAGPLMDSLFDYVYAWQKISGYRMSRQVRGNEKKELLKTRAEVARNFQKMKFDKKIAKSLYGDD